MRIEHRHNHVYMHYHVSQMAACIVGVAPTSKTEKKRSPPSHGDAPVDLDWQRKEYRRSNTTWRTEVVLGLGACGLDGLGAAELPYDETCMMVQSWARA